MVVSGRELHLSFQPLAALTFSCNLTLPVLRILLCDALEVFDRAPCTGQRLDEPRELTLCVCKFITQDVAVRFAAMTLGDESC